MAKKRSAKWRAWNKGLVLGQKDAFTPDQVKRIRRMLARRGDDGLRDLALFSVAIDTMLQGPELLNLAVKDVLQSDGKVRTVIEVAAAGESQQSDASCPRHRQTPFENGLRCPAKNARIMFSPAAAIGFLVR